MDYIKIFTDGFNDIKENPNPLIGYSLFQILFSILFLLIDGVLVFSLLLTPVFYGISLPDLSNINPIILIVGLSLLLIILIFIHLLLITFTGVLSNRIIYLGFKGKQIKLNLDTFREILDYGMENFWRYFRLVSVHYSFRIMIFLIVIALIFASVVIGNIAIILVVILFGFLIFILVFLHVLWTLICVVSTYLFFNNGETKPVFSLIMSAYEFISKNVVDIVLFLILLSTFYIVSLVIFMVSSNIFPLIPQFLYFIFVFVFSYYAPFILWKFFRELEHKS